MSLSPIQPSFTVRPVAQGVVAAKAPAIAAKATEGEPDLKTPTGIAKWAADKLVKAGGDIKKLPLWEKILVGVVGFVVGWKFNDWVHKQVEKKEGENWDKYGQDQYLSLKSQGTEALVKELAEPHTFTQNVKDWDILQKKWGAFCTYTVLRESAVPTLGTYNGKDNAPVALIALASNKTADDNAIKMLALDIKRRGNGAPAKQAFYADVVKALKETHGVVVSYDQVNG